MWIAKKRKVLTRKTRGFLWKSTQNAYELGRYWTRIEEYQERGICPLCEEIEDMDYVLTRCTANTQALAWQMANELWARKHPNPLPNTIGCILGCGMANFSRDGRPGEGKNRPHRILSSETACPIRKPRNERRIRDGDGQPQAEREIRNR